MTPCPVPRSDGSTPRITRAIGTGLRLGLEPTGASTAEPRSRARGLSSRARIRAYWAVEIAMTVSVADAVWICRVCSLRSGPSRSRFGCNRLLSNGLMCKDSSAGRALALGAGPIVAAWGIQAGLGAKKIKKYLTCKSLSDITGADNKRNCRTKSTTHYEKTCRTYSVNCRRCYFACCHRNVHNHHQRPSSRSWSWPSHGDRRWILHF